MHENVTVLIPIFNDWSATQLLLEHLDKVLPTCYAFDVLLIDDGSTEEGGDILAPLVLNNIRSVSVLTLRCNLGHQRAIAVGLCYVEMNSPCRAVIIMDGDGEDDPRDVVRLLERLHNEDTPKIIFAERTRRSEKFAFRIFYHLYRVAHFLLTGIAVRVGNFSAVPKSLLYRLVAVSDLWNHYAAAVFKARLPYTTVPTKRARRLTGESQMNFIGLVIHGLSAISVFGDRIGVRLLICITALIMLALCGMVVTILVRFTTGLAIPGWATYTLGILLILFTQMSLLTLVFVFVVLAGRDNFSFIPIRDHVYFIAKSYKIYERQQ